MSQPPQILVVGRANPASPYDIEIPASEKSVSRPHLEITIDRNGRYYVSHLGQNATFMKVQGQWKPLLQDYVDADAPLKLGDYQTTIRELLANRLQKSFVPSPPVQQKFPTPAPRERAKKQVWDAERAAIVWRYEDE